MVQCSQKRRSNKKMNPELWYDYILDKIDGVASLIDSVPAIDGAKERLEALENAEDQLEEIARKDLRQFKFEIRLVQDTSKRRKSEKDFRSVQIKLRVAEGHLSSMKAGERRRELMNGDEGDRALAQASLMQDETQSAISNMKRMVTVCKDIGTSSLEELRRQRKVIEKIDREADKGADKLSRSKKLVKRFQRGIIFRNF